MDSLLSKDYAVGAYFTLLLAELVNWGCWFVHLLELHFSTGTAANFMPYLVPVGWPVLPLLSPLLVLAVVIPCAVLVALLFRFTSFPGSVRVRRKLVIYSAASFAALYAMSLPAFFVWNLGGA